MVEIDALRLKGISEKPEHNFFVNTGMYCLTPKALDFIPKKQFFDMTDLIDTLLNNGLPVSCYQVKKYWIDIGQYEDLERARSEYHLHF